MTNYSKLLILGILTLVLVLSYGSASAANPFPDGLVNCDSSFKSTAGEGGTREPVSNVCDYQAFLDLIGVIFTWLVWISVPLATLGIGIGGVHMIWGGASETQRTRGKEIFWDSIIGFVIVVAAWLLVRTMLTYLGVPTTGATQALFSVFGS